MSFNTVAGGRSDFKEFAFVCYGKDIPDVLTRSFGTINRLRQYGYMHEAQQLERYSNALRADMVKLGNTMAIRGTAILREIERGTRVRPEGRGGGHRGLNDSLWTRPLIIPGGIGIADFVELDANVRWWPTNEWGSSARIGGYLYGHFYGGAPDSAPSPSQFREHALFQSGTGPGTGYGEIVNPIPARHFIRDSKALIDHEWGPQYEALISGFESQLDQILDEVLKQNATRLP